MELKSELQQIWGINSDWQLIPLGKGFYTLYFTTATNKATSKKKVIWELSKGLLRLWEWARNFDPFKENSPLGNVWVRIHYLPIEYWNSQVISGIGRYLGHPLKIDGASAGRDFGQFARILVEIDMSLPLLNTLLIDMEDFSFQIEFVFENLPLYCGRCKITGHSPDRCRKSKFGGMGEQNDTVNDKGKITQVHNGPHWQAAINSNEQAANINVQQQLAWKPAQPEFGQQQAAPLTKQQLREIDSMYLLLMNRFCCMGRMWLR
ncbi:uncharacterized protein LOC130990710 [Salvia miltiorrhiza]|uniref:uncharacterized protein LOC130990710 n=1 Tax=Salvia miltiorrhiza TaxID=226208 RepID=UPI0025AB9EDD|nr:uncharacterized protein LOC130990710 [Salvia miltiorrhiza]